MIKKALLAGFLVILYVVAFAVGSFVHPFGIVRTLSPHGVAVRLFVWDGVLLMVGIYLLALGLEAAVKQFRRLAGWTTASLVVACLLGYLLRLGFVTKEF